MFSVAPKKQEGNGPIDQRATRAEKTTSEVICPKIWNQWPWLPLWWKNLHAFFLKNWVISWLSEASMPYIQEDAAIDDDVQLRGIRGIARLGKVFWNTTDGLSILFAMPLFLLAALFWNLLERLVIFCTWIRIIYQDIIKNTLNQAETPPVHS